MAVIINEFLKYYKFLIDDYADKRTSNYPLIASPVEIFVLLGTYLWFVKKWGPEFMANRNPVNIDSIIQVYNVLQVLLCSYCGIMGASTYFDGTINFWCGDVDYEDTPKNRIVINTIYVYFLLKIFDLFDTVFFVLRKKHNQISFLHLYHHTAMVVIVWVGVKYVAGGHGVFLGTVNSFVHVAMYTYYFISNYDREYAKKNLWWKKYLTQMQMFQFVATLIHGSFTLYVPECTYPKVIIYLLIPQNLFITMMFWDFYKRAYLAKPSTNEAKRNR